MAGFDLHVHSNFSDGELSVEDLALLAKTVGLSGFAVTDHDTVEGLGNISKIGSKSGINVLPGLEISTEWQGREVHILAYRFNPQNRSLLKTLGFLAQARIKRVEEMVARIAALGYPLMMEDVARIAAKGTIGRPHIALALMEKGIFSTPAKAFETLLAPGKPGYIPRVKFSPMEAVDLVLSAGGIPVLAHPGQDDAFMFLPLLLAAGLKGLEVYHSSHSCEEEARFLEIAKKKNLIFTAGSDFHGQRVKAGVDLGCRRLSYEELERQGFF